MLSTNLRQSRGHAVHAVLPRHELSEELKLAELLPSIELQSAESQAKVGTSSGEGASE